MQITWQMYAWIVTFAVIGCLVGWFTAAQSGSVAFGVFIGFLAFIVPIAAFLIWLGVAMNTDI